jgi:hypothetical protein
MIEEWEQRWGKEKKKGVLGWGGRGGRKELKGDKECSGNDR